MKTPNRKCETCVYAVKMEGKRNKVCSHASSMGKFTIQQARKFPRWLELITFRGLCGKAGAYWKRRDRKKEVAPEDRGEKPLPFTAGC